jgi:hypothetical protein
MKRNPTRTRAKKSTRQATRTIIVNRKKWLRGTDGGVLRDDDGNGAEHSRRT